MKLAALSLVGSLAEAIALVCLVVLLTHLAGGARPADVHIPLFGTVAVTTQVLIWVGLGVATIRALFHLAATRLAVRLSADYEEDLRTAFYRGFLEASWAAQSAQSAGAAHELLATDVEMSRTIIDTLSHLILGLFGLIVLTITALALNPWTGIALAVATALLYAVGRPLSNALRRAAQGRTTVSGAWADENSETLALARDIRIFRAEDYVLGRMHDHLERLHRIRLRSEFVGRLGSVLYQSGIPLIAIAGVGALYLIGPSSTASTVPSALLLLRSVSYAQAVQVALQTFNERLPHMDRLYGRLDELHEAQEPPGRERLARAEHIRLVNVGFEYRPHVPVLDNVNVTLDRGDLIGVIGPSGSGKSTLAQLILGLRQPTAGNVSVDSISLERIARDDWYRLVSLVPQEPMLLRGSIEDNIRFGRTHLAPEDITAAAKRANIHNEIAALDAGYETTVATSGLALSGGQRQRIAIARALAGKPEWLIMDEPTSALDVHSEQAIRATLQDLRGDVGVIVIAHRLSTLEGCDQLLVLLAGRMVAFGKPSDVAKTSRYYADVLRLSRLVDDSTQRPHDALVERP